MISSAVSQGLNAPPPPPLDPAPELDDELELLDDELLLEDELLDEEDDDELVTVSVLLALAVVPAELVSTQRNCSPVIASVGAKTVSVVVVTPE